MAENNIFTIALSFPTVIYTVLGGLMLGFWSLFLLGIVNMGHSVDLDVVGMQGAGVDAGVGGASRAFDSSRLFARLGLGGTPPVLVVTLMALFGWFACVGATGLGWAPAVVLVAGTAAAWLLTAIFSRPLRPLFRDYVGQSKEALVGRTAVIFTGSVTADFGQARVGEDMVQVRCPQENNLARGDHTEILEYDKENNVFLVAPVKTQIDGGMVSRD